MTGTQYYPSRKKSNHKRNCQQPSANNNNKKILKIEMREKKKKKDCNVDSSLKCMKKLFFLNIIIYRIYCVFLQKNSHFLFQSLAFVQWKAEQNN